MEIGGPEAIPLDELAREALSASGIPLTGESVGGDYGRTARLLVADGRLEVSSVAHGVHTL